MNRERAENRAKVLNAMVKHPSLSYEAMPMAPTKWEKDRYGVGQRFKSDIVGIAVT